METAKGTPVFLDVQGEGPPGRGILLEVAWAVGEGPVRAFTVRTPPGAEVSRRVRTLTGLPGEGLGGLHPAEAAHLLRAVRDLGFPVAHHALFERKWLEALTGCSWADSVCTREMARTLLPGLGAYSLRAVAGHLGFALSEKRRAGDHVEATRHIWRHMPSEPERRSPGVPREARLAAPEAPGVYLMLDARGGVLYVGRSRNLRGRLGSWFTGSRPGPARELAARTHGVRWIPCSSVLEAFVLEAGKILEYDPPCNTAGRTTACSCRYLDADWAVHEKEPKGVFRGPFPSRASMEGLLLGNGLLQGGEPGPYASVLSIWRDLCGERSLYRVGLEAYRREEAHEDPLLERLIRGVAEGALHARRGAVLRLLQGCTVGNGTVELLDPVAWPSAEGRLKVTAALLAGLREVLRTTGREGLWIRLRSGITLKAEQLQGLLAVV